LDAASSAEYDVTHEPAFYTPETKLLSAVSNPLLQMNISHGSNKIEQCQNL